MDPVGDLSKCSWRLFRMKTSFVTALVLVALASCTRTQGDEGLTPPRASPSVGDVSSSPQSSAEFLGRITEPRGPEAPPERRGLSPLRAVSPVRASTPPRPSRSS